MWESSSKLPDGGLQVWPVIPTSLLQETVLSFDI
jgi:hypothetical protein